MGHQFGPAELHGHASAHFGDVNNYCQSGCERDRSQHQREVANWFSLTDFAKKQTDQISRRERGTGRWFLNHPLYQYWCENKNVTLFCPGIPGSGKSMVIASVVEDLQMRFAECHDVAVIYFYCNFNRQAEGDIRQMLAVLIRQLFQEQSQLPAPVHALYSRHRNRATRPSEQELKDLLRELVGQYSRVFVMVDALDECQNADQERDKLLAELFHLQTRQSQNVNILATSRPLPEVTKEFAASPRIEIRAHSDDIDMYITKHMKQLPGFVAQKKDLQEEIKQRIIEAADGMFLLARLQFDALRDMLNPRALKDCLAKFTKGFDGLENTYNDALDRIDGQRQTYRDLARKALLWITYSVCELSIKELQEAIAIRPGAYDIDHDQDLIDADTIVSACRGLVEVDFESNVIRLVHYTTQEYFLRVRDRYLPEGHLEVTRSCITYLSMGVFDHDRCHDGMDLSSLIKKYKLLEYAGKNWGTHAKRVNDQQICTEISRLLNTVGYLRFFSQLIFVGWDWRRQRYGSYISSFSAIHVCAHFGLEMIVQEVIRDGDDLNCTASDGRTPLLEAARRGHTTFAELLLDKGADANAPASIDDYDIGYLEEPCSALKAASFEGNEKLVQVLLDRGANVNAEGDCFDSDPLLEALINGYEKVAWMLLAHDADVNTEGGRGTPLQLASENGYEDMVQALLDKGAAVDDGFTSYDALSRASVMGHDGIVRILLEHGANINARGKYYDFGTNRSVEGPALLAAAAEGHEKVVELLIKQGAEINARGVYTDHTKDEVINVNALQIALARCHENTVQMLREAGASLPES